MNLIDLVGVIGGLLFLFAFYRTSIGRWTGKSLWYELDNLLGAVCMSAYAITKGAYVNVALNVVWGIVAFRGLTSIAERRNWNGKSRRRKRK